MPADPAPAPRVLLTRPEACRALCMCERTLRSYSAPHGPIPVVRVGRLVRYRAADLEAFADSLLATAGASAPPA